MRVQEVEWYADSPSWDRLVIITETPQTNSEWLFKYIADNNKADAVRLEPADISTQLSAVKKTSNTIIIKNAEIPVLSGFSSADQSTDAFVNLTKTYEHVFVCITIGENLVDPYFETGQQLARMTSSLLFEAQLILQLQPLSTGRARDITGRLVVARGPSCERPVLEKEYFYFVQRMVELRECH